MGNTIMDNVSQLNSTIPGSFRGNCLERYKRADSFTAPMAGRLNGKEVG
jgi:hypothetical protein